MKNEELKPEQEENVSGGYIVEQKSPMIKHGDKELKVGHSKLKYLVTRDNNGLILGRYATKAEAMDIADKLDVSDKEISEEDNNELRKILQFRD